MRSYHITIDYHDKFELLEQSNSPPVRSFTTAWFKRNLGFFRVHASVVGPKSEQPKYNLSLSDSESQDIIQAASNMVKLLEEKLR